jgi:hypothetical protein
VLHLSELSDQLDVTLESSKKIKLAFKWVADSRDDSKRCHQIKIMPFISDAIK